VLYERPGAAHDEDKRCSRIGSDAERGRRSLRGGSDIRIGHKARTSAGDRRVVISAAITEDNPNCSRASQRLQGL